MPGNRPHRRRSPRRAAKLNARFVGHPWAEGRFPLFGDEMTRADCVDHLRRRAIPHDVPRSVCVFRPYRSNAEWRRLRDSDPSSCAGAVELDEALRRPGTVANRNMEQAIHPHRSCPPLVDVDLGGGDMTGGVAHLECEGMCGV